MSEAAVGDLRSRLNEAQQLALLPEDPSAAEAAIEGRNGPGRPPGAVNRATRQMRDFLLRNFTDPAVGLAACGLPSDLAAAVAKAGAVAAMLGCKKIEALEFMRRCSEALMPYTHSKQPIAVQISGKVAQLHIGLGLDAADGRMGGDAVAELLDSFAGALAAEDLVELEKLDETET